MTWRGWRCTCVTCLGLPERGRDDCQSCGGTGEFVASGVYRAVSYPGRAGQGFAHAVTAGMTGLEVLQGMRLDFPALRESGTSRWLKYRWTEIRITWDNPDRQVHDTPVHFSHN